MAYLQISIKMSFFTFNMGSVVFQHEGIWLNSSLSFMKEHCGCLNRKAGQFELCVALRLVGCCMYTVGLMTLQFPSHFDLLYLAQGLELTC